MAMKLFVAGERPSWNSCVYSKPLITRKPRAQSSVRAMKMRPLFRSPKRRYDHAMITVTDEAMRTNVLSVASGTLRNVQPRGHDAALLRSRMYDENSAPKSMTSDARNSQMPNLALYSPVSGRGWTLYGISSS